jgi:hypothetical protein
VLLYYRGHVYVDGTEAYLAAAECDPQTPQTDVVSVAGVVQQLANCGTVGNAFLVLDVSCPSGPATLRPILAAAIARLSKVETSVGILATCLPSAQLVRNGESPVVHWLNRGLTGPADADFDRRVSFGETGAWMTKHLAEYADVQVFTSRPGVAGAELSRERDVKLEEAIDDLANAIAAQLHDQGVELVALPDLDFLRDDVEDAAVPGSSGGPLARLCTEQLRSAIARRSQARYELVPRRELMRLLKAHDVGPDSIQSEHMQTLGRTLADEFGVDRVAMLLGRVRHRGKQRLSLTCTPWDSQKLVPWEKVMGKVFLTPSEWALTGDSAVNQLVVNQFLKIDTTSDSGGTTLQLLPPKADGDLDYFREEDRERALTEIERLHANAQTIHPLHPDARPPFPFRISLKVEGQSPEPQWSPDRRHMYVRLNKCDTYAVWIDNQSDSDVFLRLLVDGLNTLPDYPAGLPSYERSSQKLLPAQAVSLTRARPWNCDPGQSVVAGFFTRFTAGQGELRKFEVVDAAESEAYRSGYHENVGVVTAAFYAPMTRPAHKGVSADVGTKLGEKATTKVEAYRGNQVPGGLLGVIHIRYGIAP